MAVLVNAQITYTKKEDSTTQIVYTSETGEYTIDILPNTSYSISIEKNGYDTMTIPEQQFPVSQTNTNYRLDLSQ